jgi:hypothetical protein
MDGLAAARAAHDEAWKQYQRELAAIDGEMSERRHEAFKPVREANERIGKLLRMSDGRE